MKLGAEIVNIIVVGDKVKANGTVGPSAPISTNILSFDERV